MSGPFDGELREATDRLENVITFCPVESWKVELRGMLVRLRSMRAESHGSPPGDFLVIIEDWGGERAKANYSDQGVRSGPVD